MSYYSCMYLVPKEIYDKLFSTIDENDKRKVKKLNNAELGNESGAFPNIPPDPNNSSISDNDHANDPNSSPRNDGHNTSSSHNESTDSHSHNDSVHSMSTSTEGPLSPLLPVNNFGVNIRDTSTPKPPTVNNFGDNIRGSNTHKPPTLAKLQNLKLPENLVGMSPFRSENVLNIQQNSNITDQVPSVIPKQITSKSLVPIPTSIIKETKNLPTVQTQSVRKRSHKCDVCDIEFPYVRELNRHLKEKHPIFKKNRAKKAEKNSDDISDQKLPMQQQNVDVPLPEITLPINQPNKEYFQVNNPYRCDICNIIFQDELIFLEHLQLHKNKTNLVNNKRKFLTGKKRTNLKYDNWIKNKKTHTIKNKKKPNKNLFKLDDDDESMTESVKAISSDDEEMNVPTQSNIKHDETVNMSSDDDDLAAFECKLCSFYFSTEKQLERHIKNMHDADKNYNSKHTQGKKRKTHETNHNISYRTIPKPKKFAKFFYKCKLCVHTFSKKEALMRHIKNIHQADENYVSTLPQGQKRKLNSSNTIKEKNYKKWK